MCDVYFLKTTMSFWYNLEPPNWRKGDFNKVKLKTFPHYHEKYTSKLMNFTNLFFC